jgi:hypothetical protein
MSKENITTGKDGKPYFGKGTEGGRAPDVSKNAQNKKTIEGISAELEATPLEEYTYSNPDGSKVDVKKGWWVTIEKKNGKQVDGLVTEIEPNRVAIYKLGWVFTKGNTVVESHKIEKVTLTSSYFEDRNR